MEEERQETKMPPELTKIPEFLQGDRWFEMDVGDDFLNFEEPYTPPRYTLERNGVPFANVGELHVVSGKPGHGKTGLMSQLMATLLCGKFGKTQYALSEERPKPIVLYIDTEQGKDDTIAIKNRVCTLASLDYKKPQEQFRILRLRDTEEATDRWRKILKAIWEVRPTDIFLDGALDIVKDYNNQEECQPIIRKSMMLATHYDASMWMVLHENPMVEKLVGTLGSIVQRKVAEIFTVVKVKQQELKPNDRNAGLPDIYFRVKQVKARGRDVADWLFEYVPGLGGWGMPIELDDLGGRIEDPEEAKRKKEIEETDNLFKKFNWSHTGLRYTDIESYIKSTGITNKRKIQDLFNIARENGIIYQDDKRKYYYNGLNKELPDDTVEAIPFDQPDGEDVPF